MDKKLILINKNTLESLEENEIEKIIEKFTRTGMQILSADYGFMFWKLNKENKYKIAYISPETPYKPKLPRKNGYNEKASKGRVPYFITNPKRDLLPFMKSLAIIPIFYKSHQYGNIVLCFKNKRVFTDMEKPLIMTLSNSAAQVLTIHREHKRSEKDYVNLLKQKDEFFNIVSHELKTPITTIKGFSQILAQTKDFDVKKIKPLFQKIYSQADKLSNLINDLLSVSHIETGKIKFNNTNFELCELTKQVINNIKVSVNTHKITFKSNNKFWIEGDAYKIERVIINLINNAVKYSPANTKINICIKDKKGHACFDIEDFGYGIPKKDSKKIFSRFYQSDNSNKKNISGLGLGLYISSTIIKHHGGNLSFESKTKTDGTIFTFTIPYYEKK